MYKIKVQKYFRPIITDRLYVIWCDCWAWILFLFILIFKRLAYAVLFFLFRIFFVFPIYLGKFFLSYFFFYPCVWIAKFVFYFFKRCLVVVFHHFKQLLIFLATAYYLFKFFPTNNQLKFKENFWYNNLPRTNDLEKDFIQYNSLFSKFYRVRDFKPKTVLVDESTFFRTLNLHRVGVHYKKPHFVGIRGYPGNFRAVDPQMRGVFSLHPVKNYQTFEHGWNPNKFSVFEFLKANKADTFWFKKAYSSTKLYDFKTYLSDQGNFVYSLYTRGRKLQRYRRYKLYNDYSSGFLRFKNVFSLSHRTLFRERLAGTSDNHSALNLNFLLPPKIDNRGFLKLGGVEYYLYRNDSFFLNLKKNFDDQYWWHVTSFRTRFFCYPWYKKFYFYTSFKVLEFVNPFLKFPSALSKSVGSEIEQYSKILDRSVQQTSSALLTDTYQDSYQRLLSRGFVQSWYPFKRYVYNDQFLTINWNNFNQFRNATNPSSAIFSTDPFDSKFSKLGNEYSYNFISFYPNLTRILDPLVNFLTNAPRRTLSGRLPMYKVTKRHKSQKSFRFSGDWSLSNSTSHHVRYRRVSLTYKKLVSTFDLDKFETAKPIFSVFRFIKHKFFFRPKMYMRTGGRFKTVMFDNLRFSKLKHRRHRNLHFPVSTEHLFSKKLRRRGRRAFRYFTPLSKAGDNQFKDSLLYLNKPSRTDLSNFCQLKFYDDFSRTLRRYKHFKGSRYFHDWHMSYETAKTMRKNFSGSFFQKIFYSKPSNFGFFDYSGYELFSRSSGNVKRIYKKVNKSGYTPVWSLLRTRRGGIPHLLNLQDLLLTRMNGFRLGSTYSHLSDVFSYLNVPSQFWHFSALIRHYSYAHITKRTLAGFRPHWLKHSRPNKLGVRAKSNWMLDAGFDHMYLIWKDRTFSPGIYSSLRKRMTVCDYWVLRRAFCKGFLNSTDVYRYLKTSSLIFSVRKIENKVLNFIFNFLPSDFILVEFKYQLVTFFLSFSFLDVILIDASNLLSMDVTFLKNLLIRLLVCFSDQWLWFAFAYVKISSSVFINTFFDDFVGGYMYYNKTYEFYNVDAFVPLKKINGKNVNDMGTRYMFKKTMVKDGEFFRAWKIINQTAKKYSSGTNVPQRLGKFFLKRRNFVFKREFSFQNSYFLRHVLSPGWFRYSRRFHSVNHYKSFFAAGWSFKNGREFFSIEKIFYEFFQYFVDHQQIEFNQRAFTNFVPLERFLPSGITNNLLFGRTRYNYNFRRFVVCHFNSSSKRRSFLNNLLRDEMLSFSRYDYKNKLRYGHSRLNPMLLPTKLQYGFLGLMRYENSFCEKLNYKNPLYLIDSKISTNLFSSEDTNIQQNNTASYFYSFYTDSLRTRNFPRKFRYFYLFQYNRFFKVKNKMSEKTSGRYFALSGKHKRSAFTERFKEARAYNARRKFLAFHEKYFLKKARAAQIIKQESFKDIFRYHNKDNFSSLNFFIRFFNAYVHKVKTLGDLFRYTNLRWVTGDRAHGGSGHKIFKFFARQASRHRKLHRYKLRQFKNILAPSFLEHSQSSTKLPRIRHNFQRNVSFPNQLIHHVDSRLIDYETFRSPFRHLKFLKTIKKLQLFFYFSILTPIAKVVSSIVFLLKNYLFVSFFIYILVGSFLLFSIAFYRVIIKTYSNNSLFSDWFLSSRNRPLSFFQLFLPYAFIDFLRLVFFSAANECICKFRQVKLVIVRFFKIYVDLKIYLLIVLKFYKKLLLLKGYNLVRLLLSKKRILIGLSLLSSTMLRLIRSFFVTITKLLIFFITLFLFSFVLKNYLTLTNKYITYLPSTILVFLFFIFLIWFLSIISNKFVSNFLCSPTDKHQYLQEVSGDLELDVDNETVQHLPYFSIEEEQETEGEFPFYYHEDFLPDNYFMDVQLHKIITSKPNYFKNYVRELRWINFMAFDEESVNSDIVRKFEYEESLKTLAFLTHLVRKNKKFIFEFEDFVLEELSLNAHHAHFLYYYFGRSAEAERLESHLVDRALNYKTFLEEEDENGEVITYLGINYEDDSDPIDYIDFTEEKSLHTFYDNFLVEPTFSAASSFSPKNFFEFFTDRDSFGDSYLIYELGWVNELIFDRFVVDLNADDFFTFDHQETVSKIEPYSSFDDILEGDSLETSQFQHVCAQLLASLKPVSVYTHNFFTVDLHGLRRIEPLFGKSRLLTAFDNFNLLNASWRLNFLFSNATLLLNFNPYKLNAKQKLSLKNVPILGFELFNNRYKRKFFSNVEHYVKVLNLKHYPDLSYAEAERLWGALGCTKQEWDYVEKEKKNGLILPYDNNETPISIAALVLGIYYNKLNMIGLQPQHRFADLFPEGEQYQLFFSRYFRFMEGVDMFGLNFINQFMYECNPTLLFIDFFRIFVDFLDNNLFFKDRVVIYNTLIPLPLQQVFDFLFQKFLFSFYLYFGGLKLPGFDVFSNWYELNTCFTFFNYFSTNLFSFLHVLINFTVFTFENFLSTLVFNYNSFFLFYTFFLLLGIFLLKLVCLIFGLFL